MATFEEKAERLKKELEEAANSNQRRNLSREYELTLRLLRIIRGEVFMLDDINKCRLEIMREYPEYERPITAHSGILLAAEAIRRSFGHKYYLPLYKYPIILPVKLACIPNIKLSRPYRCSRKFHVRRSRQYHTLFKKTPC